MGTHGTPPKAFLDKANELGIADSVEWLDDLPMNKIAPLYRRSQVCVLPTRGVLPGFRSEWRRRTYPHHSHAGGPHPDHIDDLGIYVGGDDPDELANRIYEVLNNEFCGRILERSCARTLNGA